MGRISYMVPTPEGREQRWRGKDHAMSWTSGIIDEGFDIEDDFDGYN